MNGKRVCGILGVLSGILIFVFLYLIMQVWEHSYDKFESEREQWLEEKLPELGVANGVLMDWASEKQRQIDDRYSTLRSVGRDPREDSHYNELVRIRIEYLDEAARLRRLGDDAYLAYDASLSSPTEREEEILRTLVATAKDQALLATQLNAKQEKGSLTND